jgi:uncharacterized protein (DUF2249 family)
MSKKTVTLDVREDIKHGREPFSKIMRAVAALKEDQDLLLIAPFEPAPLFKVLEQQGFSHHSTPADSGDWEVLFTRGSSKPAATVAAASKSASPARSGACSGTPTVEVDARGLEPPQPLVRILEALTALPRGARLRARTDRRPVHLHAKLEERGFVGETEEQEDGSFVTYVRRNAD